MLEPFSRESLDEKDLITIKVLQNDKKFKIGMCDLKSNDIDMMIENNFYLPYWLHPKGDSYYKYHNKEYKPKGKSEREERERQECCLCKKTSKCDELLSLIHRPT